MGNGGAGDNAEMGLSPNTVHRYLRVGQAARYKQRESRSTKLEPFKNYLPERQS
jgi:hypothetical protein